VNHLDWHPDGSAMAHCCRSRRSIRLIITVSVLLALLWLPLFTRIFTPTGRFEPDRDIFRVETRYGVFGYCEKRHGRELVQRELAYWTVTFTEYHWSVLGLVGTVAGTIAVIGFACFGIRRGGNQQGVDYP
jgi:hypothetical protein